MQEDINEFVEALTRFIDGEIRHTADPIYNQKSVRIIDARNHLFRLTDGIQTDEAEDLYALSDLYTVNEEMQTVPNRRRMQAIARNYWSE